MSNRARLRQVTAYRSTLADYSEFISAKRPEGSLLCLPEGLVLILTGVSQLDPHESREAWPVQRQLMRPAGS
jgi:hypothetical protein